MWVYVEGYRLHFSYLTIESQVLIPVTKLRGEIPIGAQKDSNLMKNIQQKSIWKLWPTFYLLKISQTLNKTSFTIEGILLNAHSWPLFLYIHYYSKQTTVIKGQLTSQ